MPDPNDYVNNLTHNINGLSEALSKVGDVAKRLKGVIGGSLAVGLSTGWTAYDIGSDMREGKGFTKALHDQVVEMKKGELAGAAAGKSLEAFGKAVGFANQRIGEFVAKGGRLAASATEISNWFNPAIEAMGKRSGVAAASLMGLSQALKLMTGTAATFLLVAEGVDKVFKSWQKSATDLNSQINTLEVSFKKLESTAKGFDDRFVARAAGSYLGPKTEFTGMMQSAAGQGIQQQYAAQLAELARVISGRSGEPMGPLFQKMLTGTPGKMVTMSETAFRDLLMRERLRTAAINPPIEIGSAEKLKRGWEGAGQYAINADLGKLWTSTTGVVGGPAYSDIGLLDRILYGPRTAARGIGGAVHYPAELAGRGIEGAGRYLTMGAGGGAKIGSDITAFLSGLPGIGYALKESGMTEAGKRAGIWGTSAGIGVTSADQQAKSDALFKKLSEIEKVYAGAEILDKSKDSGRKLSEAYDKVKKYQDMDLSGKTTEEIKKINTELAPVGKEVTEQFKTYHEMQTILQKNPEIEKLYSKEGLAGLKKQKDAIVKEYQESVEREQEIKKTLTMFQEMNKIPALSKATDAVSETVGSAENYVRTVNTQLLQSRQTIDKLKGLQEAGQKLTQPQLTELSAALIAQEEARGTLSGALDKNTPEYKAFEKARVALEKGKAEKAKPEELEKLKKAYEDATGKLPYTEGRYQKAQRKLQSEEFLYSMSIAPVVESITREAGFARVEELERSGFKVEDTTKNRLGADPSKIRELFKRKNAEALSKLTGIALDNIQKALEDGNIDKFLETVALRGEGMGGLRKSEMDMRLLSEKKRTQLQRVLSSIQASSMIVIGKAQVGSAQRAGVKVGAEGQYMGSPLLSGMVGSEAGQIVAIRQAMYDKELEFTRRYAEAQTNIIKEHYDHLINMGRLNLEAMDRQFAPHMQYGRTIFGVGQQDVSAQMGRFQGEDYWRQQFRGERGLGEARTDLMASIAGIQLPPQVHQARALRHQREQEEDFRRQQARQALRDRMEIQNYQGTIGKLQGVGVGEQELEGTDEGRKMQLSMLQSTQGAFSRRGIDVYPQMARLMQAQQVEAGQRLAMELQERRFKGASLAEQAGILEKQVAEIGEDKNEQGIAAKTGLASKYKEAAEYAKSIGDVGKYQEYQQKLSGVLEGLPPEMKAIYDDQMKVANKQLEAHQKSFNSMLHFLGNLDTNVAKISGGAAANTTPEKGVGQSKEGPTVPPQGMTPEQKKRVTNYYQPEGLKEASEYYPTYEVGPWSTPEDRSGFPYEPGPNTLGDITGKRSTAEWRSRIFGGAWDWAKARYSAGREAAKESGAIKPFDEGAMREALPYATPMGGIVGVAKGASAASRFAVRLGRSKLGLGINWRLGNLGDRIRAGQEAWGNVKPYTMADVKNLPSNIVETARRGVNYFGGIGKTAALGGLAAGTAVLSGSALQDPYADEERAMTLPTFPAGDDQIEAKQSAMKGYDEWMAKLQNKYAKRGEFAETMPGKTPEEKQRLAEEAIERVRANKVDLKRGSIAGGGLSVVPGSSTPGYSSGQLAASKRRENEFEAQLQGMAWEYTGGMDLGKEGSKEEPDVSPEVSKYAKNLAERGKSVRERFSPSELKGMKQTLMPGLEQMMQEKRLAEGGYSRMVDASGRESYVDARVTGTTSYGVWGSDKMRAEFAAMSGITASPERMAQTPEGKLNTAGDKFANAVDKFSKAKITVEVVGGGARASATNGESPSYSMPRT